MRRLLYPFILCLLFTHGSLQGQAPEKWTSCDIHEALEKLNFLGSVLYVAAHPDDENTRMISYLANERKARTAYLSLTRGDGGQNLIGTELKELLGVLRTQELLEARRIDGGQQFFSRANDFGYSKHPDETLDIWNRDEVLSDVVWTIRKFRPDVVVNRFDHDSAGRTHGHHTSSAVLSFEAFDMVGKRSVYPEQLEHVKPWSPRRLYFNTSWWFYGSREKFEKADKTGFVSVDIGSYYPCKGKSNTEIASESRSMHKCQGMGNTGSRGSRQEYLKLLKGDMPNSDSDIFEGINTTWSRVSGGENVQVIMDKIIREYSFVDPAASIADLVKARKLISKTSDAHWKKIKLDEIDQIILACAGVFLEAKAGESTANPGQDIALDIEYINRSMADISIKSIEIQPSLFDTTLNASMDFNQAYLLTKEVTLPKSTKITSPYWLTQKGELGMYNVQDQNLRGLPETPKEAKVTWTLDIAGVEIPVTKDVIYKYNDPAIGEVYQPFEVIPEYSVGIDKEVYLFTDQPNRELVVKVKAFKENAKGSVSLGLTEGWTSTPSSYDFEIKQKGAQQEFTFSITPPKNQSSIEIQPVIQADGKKYTDELIEVDYDHISRQMVLMPAKSKLVKIDLNKKGNLIGYIMGAGDKIPEQLREVGYQVEMITLDDFPSDLSKYDAIISGIRAYNVLDDIKFYQDRLMQYVYDGGTYMSQYTTSRRMKIDKIGPYDIKLSRFRVSDEFAEVRILEPEHPVFNTPNKISSADFDDWVQERGLYFASEWAPEYTALLSSNDKGEDPRDGGLLIAKYGEGYHIHSGYSWFRELPAGVPGAFRLFTNLISVGN